MAEHSEASLNPILRVFKPILMCKQHVDRGLRIIGQTRCPFCLTIGRYFARIWHERSDIVPSPIPYVVADPLPVAVGHSEASLNPIVRVFQAILRCKKHVDRDLGIIRDNPMPVFA